MEKVEKKKCNRCKVSLTFDKFNKKRDDSYMKLCIECNEKNVKYIKDNCKCEHGKRKYRCVECNGSGICEHKKLKERCIECGGGSICEHNRRRSICIECGGGSLCEHNRERPKCRICSDSIKITIQNWLNNSKKSDKKLNMFDIVNYIDKEFCKNLIEEYPNCYYCSIELQYKINQIDFATIERLDNSIGHVKSNCVIACRKCNYGKVGNLNLI
jgi:hypothetical protein